MRVGALFVALVTSVLGCVPGDSMDSCVLTTLERLRRTEKLCNSRALRVCVRHRGWTHQGDLSRAVLRRFARDVEGVDVAEPKFEERLPDTVRAMNECNEVYTLHCRAKKCGTSVDECEDAARAKIPFKVMGSFGSREQPEPASEAADDSEEKAVVTQKPTVKKQATAVKAARKETADDADSEDAMVDDDESEDAVVDDDSDAAAATDDEDVDDVADRAEDIVDGAKAGQQVVGQRVVINIGNKGSSDRGRKRRQTRRTKTEAPAARERKAASEPKARGFDDMVKLQDQIRRRAQAALDRNVDELDTELKAAKIRIRRRLARIHKLRSLAGKHEDRQEKAIEALKEAAVKAYNEGVKDGMQCRCADGPCPCARDVD